MATDPSKPVQITWRSSFIRSKCAVWPASVSRRSPAVHTPNASGHPPRRNSLTPRPSLRRNRARRVRSEEHTSELQSLMRISYAVFCLKKKKTNINTHNPHKHEHMHIKQ